MHRWLLPAGHRGRIDGGAQPDRFARRGDRRVGVQRQPVESRRRDRSGDAGAHRQGRARRRLGHYVRAPQDRQHGDLRRRQPGHSCRGDAVAAVTGARLGRCELGRGQGPLVLRQRTPHHHRSGRVRLVVARSCDRTGGWSAGLTAVGGEGVAGGGSEDPILETAGAPSPGSPVSA